MRLNSRAFLESPPNEAPHIKLAWLEGEADGLIALTGGPGGPLERRSRRQRHAGGVALRRANAKLFGDRLYIELQRHGLESERGVEPVLVDMAYAKGIPLVAANGIFASPSMFSASRIGPCSICNSKKAWSGRSPTGSPPT